MSGWERPSRSGILDDILTIFPNRQILIPNRGKDSGSFRCFIMSQDQTPFINHLPPLTKKAPPEV